MHGDRCGNDRLGRARLRPPRYRILRTRRPAANRLAARAARARGRDCELGHPLERERRAGQPRARGPAPRPHARQRSRLGIPALHDAGRPQHDGAARALLQRGPGVPRHGRDARRRRRARPGGTGARAGVGQRRGSEGAAPAGRARACGCRREPAERLDVRARRRSADGHVHGGLLGRDRGSRSSASTSRRSISTSSSDARRRSPTPRSAPRAAGSRSASPRCTTTAYG